MSEATEDEVPLAVWVQSAPTLDGVGYVVTIDADDDTSRALDSAEALRHAAAVLDAVARAEYDAAVSGQLIKKLGVPIVAVAQLLSQLRAEREPLDPEATAPIVLEPGVNNGLEPFLALSIKGKKVGQWDMADARQHAIFVMTAVAVADLDAGYLRVLTETIGLDKSRARAAVADLDEFRPKG